MLTAIAEKLRTGKKLVLLHGNADPDALGSSYAIYRSFPDVTVASFGGMARISKVIDSKLDFPVLETADLNDYDYLVAVDTSCKEQLGVDISGHEVIVIDHHADNGGWGDHQLSYIDDTKKSCAEIVFELITRAGASIDRSTGLALAAGMMTDSGHFRYANPALMRTFASVLEASGLEIDEVMDLIDLEPDVSERVSQLKGAQRMRFERKGEFIVATSLGSSHESSVCKSLLALGADVSFVGSQRADKKFRISARARQDMVTRYAPRKSS